MLDKKRLAIDILTELERVTMDYNNGYKELTINPLSPRKLAQEDQLNIETNDIRTMTYINEKVTGLEAIVKAFSTKLVEHIYDNLSLDDLSDVTISNPINGQTLVYINGEWINRSITDDIIYNSEITSAGEVPITASPTIPTHNHGQGIDNYFTKFVNGILGTIGNSSMFETNERVETRLGLRVGRNLSIGDVAHLSTNPERVLVTNQTGLVMYRTLEEIVSDVLVGEHNHDDLYYRKTELQTSGLAQVHWGNLTNKPTSFTPSTHNTTHLPGGSDAVFPSNVVGYLYNDGAGNLTWTTVTVSGYAPLIHYHATTDITSGVFDVARGGTGVGSFTAGYLKANGVSPFSTVTSIPYSDLSGVPTTFTPISHGLVSAYHTATGLTTGHFLKATSSTTFAFAAHGLTYSDVGAQAADATLTALSALDSSVGFIYQTGADTFTKYGFGGTGSATTISRSDHTHSGYEPTISSGLSTQYWRGDKTWQVLNTGAVLESTNLYFTDVRARAAMTGAITSVLTDNLSNNIVVVSNGSGKIASSSVSSTELGYLSGKNSVIDGSGTTNYFAYFSGINRITNGPIFTNGTNIAVGKSSLESWNTTYRALQIGGNTSIFASSAEISEGSSGYLNNCYNDGSWKPMVDGYASIISNSGSAFAFFCNSGLVADQPFSPTSVFSINSVGTIKSASLTASRVIYANSNKDIVSSSVTSSELALLSGKNSVIDGSGTIGYLPIFTGTNRIGNSIVTGSTAGIEINSVDSNYNGGLRIVADNTHHGVFAMGCASGGGGTQVGQWNILRFPDSLDYKLGLRYNSSDFFVFDTSGNFGIGTFSPLSKLHVSSGDENAITIGPNATWGKNLILGGWHGLLSDMTSSRIQASNGNLHIDSEDSTSTFSTYINYFSRGNTFLCYGGGNVEVGSALSEIWNTNYNVLQVGQGLSIWSDKNSQNGLFTVNAYYNPSSQFVARQTGGSVYYYMLTDEAAWHIAPSVTAGSALNFVRKMSIQTNTLYLDPDTAAASVEYPFHIDLGKTYRNNTAFGVSYAACKIFLYRGTDGSGYGFGLGSDADVQYHTGASIGRHDFYNNNVLNVRHSDTRHGFYISGNETFIVTSNKASVNGRFLSSYNCPTTQYNDTNIELVCDYSSGSKPSIGFHRSGFDAMTLLYAGGRTLQVRDHANASLDTILTTGNFISAPYMLWNNMGRTHENSFSDFNSVGISGSYYLTGPTNGPAIPSAAQYYGFTLGLGINYEGSYHCQMYWPREMAASPYVSIRTLEGGTWQAWRKIYAGYADNSDLLDGYHGSNYLGKNGNSHYISDGGWIQFPGVEGLYNPNSNSGTNFHPVGSDISYGSYQVQGAKNNWAGYVIYSSTSKATLMSYTAGTAATGIYQQSNNLWQWLHDGTDFWIYRPAIDGNGFRALHTGYISDYYLPRRSGDNWVNSNLLSNGTNTFLDTSPVNSSNYNDGLRIGRSSSGFSGVYIGAAGWVGTGEGMWSWYSDLPANSYKMYWRYNNIDQMSLTYDGNFWVKTSGGDGITLFGANGFDNYISCQTNNSSTLNLATNGASISLYGLGDGMGFTGDAIFNNNMQIYGKIKYCSGLHTGSTTSVDLPNASGGVIMLDLSTYSTNNFIFNPILFNQIVTFYSASVGTLVFITNSSSTYPIMFAAETYYTSEWHSSRNVQIYYGQAIICLCVGQSAYGTPIWMVFASNTI